MSTPHQSGSIPSQPTNPPHPTMTGPTGWFDALIRFIGSLTNERALTLAMIAIAGFVVYRVLDSQPEREASNLRAQEAQAASLHDRCERQMKEVLAATTTLVKDIQREQSSERKERAKSELERDGLRDKAQAERDSARMKYDAEEREKLQKAVITFGGELSRFRDTFGPYMKKLIPPGPEIETLTGGGMATAPMPRPKRTILPDFH